jgi:hypothetical protein
MNENRGQEVFGVFLAILGTLFLLVNNRLLWFGWAELWPSLLFLMGIFLLRVYTRRHKPRQLFVGLFLLQFGAFFFLFSSGIVDWEQMDVLWPSLPLMIGISLLSLSLAGDKAAPAVVFGLVMVIFAGVSYLAETGAIGSRLSEPFVRIWPLVLVLAGVLIFLRAKRERLGADGESGGMSDAPAAGRPPASGPASSSPPREDPPSDLI